MAQAGWRIDGTLADPLPISGGFDAPELSDLAFDKKSGQFLSVSDKLKVIYSLTLDDSTLPATVTITSKQELKKSNGDALTENTDFEGISVLRDGSRLLTSELDQSLHVYGEDNRRIQTLRSFTRVGLHRFTRRRSNKGIEGITTDTLGLIWIINEESLKPDGKARFSRLLALTPELYAGPQWAYPLAEDKGLFNSYGVSAIEALPDGQLLVLERKARFDLRYAGPALSHEIYLIAPNRKVPGLGYNISNIASLEGGNFTPLKKTLLWQGSFARRNFEGMAVGKQRRDGSFPLLLIADDGQGLKAGALLLDLHITQ